MDQNKTSQTVYFIRQSPFLLIAKLIVLEILFVSLYLAFRLPKFFLPEVISQDIFVTWSMASILFFVIISLAQILATVLITISWTNEYYIIRPGDILHRQGLFSLKEETFSLVNVEAFTVDQSFIGKIFNFGSIKLYSPVLKQDYYLNNVSNPIKLKKTIEQTVDSAQVFASKRSNEMIIPFRRR